MATTSRKVTERINYWLNYIDCALSHPKPLPTGKHVFRSDLDADPEIREIYECLFKLYTEEKTSTEFREPVNALQHGLFNYYTVITEPMSLRTILDHIAEGDYYSEVSEVMSDVEKIWSNCEKFNGPDSAITAEARKCQEALTLLIKSVADEQLASPSEVDRVIVELSTMNVSVLGEVEEYLMRDDPTLICENADVDVSRLKVKHIRELKKILQRAKNDDS
ncbi:Bromodomain [Trypanosoma melophagium]|uniref:Bromodomain n=1 Tax=Trypanosoma melophagium TaxID=715481 RepID=UPI00351A0B1E|nr:Bromodomain [Trypanosoma melophagium]